MLTKEEVVTKLATIYAELYEIFSNGSLQNGRLSELQEQITELQKKCPHDFSSAGVCEYCGKKENEND